MTVVKDNLPALEKNATPVQITEYATQTFVHEDYVRNQLRKNTHMPRSLCGIIVEAESKPWGVLVIDSSLPQLVAKDKLEAFFQKHAKVLGKLLAKL